MMDELLSQFLIEGRELIAAAYAHLRILRDHPTNAPQVDSAFRAFHTLKGSVGLFDMAPAGSLLHAGEDVLDRARSGRGTLDVEAVSSLVDCIDHVDRWIDAIEAYGRLPADAMTVASRLMARLSGDASSHVPDFPGGPTKPAWIDEWLLAAASLIEAVDRPLVAFRYEPDADCFFRGDDPLKIVNSTPEILALRVVVKAARPSLDQMNPFECGLVIEGLSSASMDAVRAVFRSVGEQSSLIDVPARRREQAVLDTGARTLRVDASRIDALAGDVGELVLVGNQLARVTNEVARLNADLGGQLRQLQAVFERGLASLHRNVTAVRMVSLAPTLRRLPRMVREIAAGVGRNVYFEVEGEATEVDKAIADMVFEPLLHLVRNAIDHGIEAPERRLTVQKSFEGNVRLGIRRDGQQVVLSLADDGAGMDPNKIRTMAVERGLITIERATALDDGAILQLVFAPGFSTAEKVTDFSGRGVGMDAVKSAVENFGGAVSIESVLGQGTTTTLRLPLSAITTRLLLVRVGPDRYGVPFDSILETAAVSHERIIPVGQGHAFVLRNSTVPVVSLASLLGTSSENARVVRLLVVQALSDRIALITDGFDDQIEALVRPPSRLLARLPGIAGTTVLGDGQVLLVLDPARLIA